MKLQHIVVYDSSLDNFDIGHCWIKVHVTVGFRKFSPFTAIQIARSYNFDLAQVKDDDTKHVCSSHNNKKYEHRHT